MKIPAQPMHFLNMRCIIGSVLGLFAHQVWDSTSDSSFSYFYLYKSMRFDTAQNSWYQCHLYEGATISLAYSLGSRL